MGKRSASVAFAAVAAAAAGVASARLIDEVSFDLLGNTGRSPSETMSGWQLTGDAVLIDTFVRLTPDEQHKRGGMSARHGMPPESGGADDDGWTADVTLRIHGVGASLAGDGVAVWLTQAPVQPGPLFGGESRFRGLLLGLDTYVNSVDAGAHPHPYVGIAINDGSELVTQDAAGLTTTAHGPAGCSVTQARQVGAHESRVITLRARYVRSARSLKLAYTYGAGPQDYRHRADTEWVSCASVSDVDIPQGFHWGATAATGAVSDNHDVLSLRVYRGAADAALAGAPSALPRPEDAYVFQPHAPAVDAAAAAAQQAPPPSQDQQQQAQQPPAPQIVRPTLEQVDEGLRRSHFLTEFSQKVTETESRLAHMRTEIDHRIDNMYQHMEGLLLRLQHSEEALDDRLGRLEETLRAQLAALQAEHAESSSRWMLPYIALCSVAAVIGLWGLKQYRALNKLHKY